MPEITETVRVRAPRDLVYELLRDPETFVSIVSGLEEAEREGRTLRWEATGPLGIPMPGAAEVTQEVSAEKVRWNTVEGALDAHGSIEIAEEDGETLVRYVLRYEVPGGKAGEALANASDLDRHVREALQRFRQLAESRRSGG